MPIPASTKPDPKVFEDALLHGVEVADSDRLLVSSMVFSCLSGGRELPDAVEACSSLIGKAGIPSPVAEALRRRLDVLRVATKNTTPPPSR